MGLSNRMTAPRRGPQPSTQPTTRPRITLQVTVKDTFETVLPLLRLFDNVTPADPKLVSVFAKNTIAAQKIIDSFIEEDRVIKSRFLPDGMEPAEFAEDRLTGAAVAATEALRRAVESGAGEFSAKKEKDAAEKNLAAFRDYEKALGEPLKGEKHDLVLRVIDLGEIIPDPDKLKQSSLAMLMKRGIVVSDDD